MQYMLRRNKNNYKLEKKTALAKDCFSYKLRYTIQDSLFKLVMSWTTSLTTFVTFCHTGEITVEAEGFGMIQTPTFALVMWQLTMPQIRQQYLSTYLAFQEKLRKSKLPSGTKEDI